MTVADSDDAVVRRSNRVLLAGILGGAVVILGVAALIFYRGGLEADCEKDCHPYAGELGAHNTACYCDETRKVKERS